MTTKKRVNRNDLTTRNLHAAKRSLAKVNVQLAALTERVEQLEQAVSNLVSGITQMPGMPA